MAKLLVKLSILITAFLLSSSASSQTTWNIDPGWNLLGNHTIGPIDMSFAGLNDASKVNSVWTWNRTTGKWAFYAPSLSASDLAAYAQGKGYEVLSSIPIKQGFWINASTRFTLSSYWNAHGDTLALYDLQKGWNLLGPTLAKTPAQILDALKPGLYAPDKSIATVWTWDAATSKWRFYAPNLDQAGTLSDYINRRSFEPFVAPIAAGEGYWINLTDPNLADFVTVPVDISKVTYPGSYSTPPARVADISSDPCNLDLSVVSFPKSWLGSYSLPAIRGAPLASDVSRGVFLKDIMAKYNPAYVGSNSPNSKNGCTGDLRVEFDKTISRLKALGADYAYMVQWHWVSKRADGTWYITSAKDSAGQLEDADLKYFVDKAHAAGLKIYMANQIQGMVDSEQGGAAYVPADSQENYTKWLTAYREFMIERSAFFQSVGIDLWAMSCGCIYRDEGNQSAEAVSLFKQEYNTILTEVKKVYKGKTASYQHSWLLSDTNYLNQIDVIEIGINTTPPNFSSTATFGFDYYKSVMESSDFMATYNSLKPYGKTIMISFGIQSRSNAMTRPGYMEETVCTADVMGTLNGSQTECVQRGTSPDFSLQAIVYEATLEILGTLPNPAGLIIFASDYWETDPLIPQTAYPNIGASFRNKPAEGIVRAWFAR